MEIIVIFILYFLPTLIAGYRKHHNGGSILVINLLLGWTFIGWVIALAMSTGHVKEITK
jgi:hypothetical protein